MSIDSTVLDHSRVEQFMGKTLGDPAGLFASVMAIVGDRLGLFALWPTGDRQRRTSCPSAPGSIGATPWSGCAACMRPAIWNWVPDGRFVLPAEHAQMLADLTDELHERAIQLLIAREVARSATSYATSWTTAC